jgi:hypothetical protein
VGRAGARRRNLILVSAAIAALAAPFVVASCTGSGSSTSGEAGGGAAPPDDAGSGGHDAAGGHAGDAGGHHDGGHHDAGGHPDASDDGDAAASDADAACNSVEMGYPLQAGIHVPICSYIDWPTNPPTSGEHYPIWAAYRAYDKPVPRGFSVHDLEHGGVVVSYNCPGGCDAEVAALEAWLAARPADPTCTPPVHARITVTPDPLLDVRFAAASWGFSLKSDCFDLDALGAFIDAHYRMAPEDFCDDGIDPTSPDAGLPADCGDPPDSGAPDGGDAGPADASSDGS